MANADLRPVSELSNNLARIVPQLVPGRAVFLHYCSLEAFYSIISTGNIRYTSARSTNDPSEFLLGHSIVRDCLDATLPRIMDKEELDEYITHPLIDRKFKAFVFCMTEAEGDEEDVGELGQWRLYGSDGRGVALVFDVSVPNIANLLAELGSIPRKVVYGEEAGRALVESIVENYLREFDSFPEATKRFVRELKFQIPQLLLNSIFWLPSVIKHGAYRHEREVRLVRGDIGAHAGNPLLFFEKGGVRRPTIERPIAVLKEPAGARYMLSPIRKVIIGPSGDQSAIEDSLGYFMESHGWDLTIKRSNIPYRAL